MNAKMTFNHHGKMNNDRKNTTSNIARFIAIIYHTYSI